MDGECGSPLLIPCFKQYYQPPLSRGGGGTCTPALAEMDRRSLTPTTVTYAHPTLFDACVGDWE